MQTFQAVCAKNGQKVELIVKYNTLDEARSGLHDQGYSIIEIKTVDDAVVFGKAFYFDILVDGKNKSGQIQSSDILKAYIKLVDDLHYEVVRIYESPQSNDEEKLLTTSKIRASYNVYNEKRAKNSLRSVKKEGEKDIQFETRPDNISESVVGKELLQYYWLVEKILSKIEYIINTYGKELSEEKRTRLQETYIAIRQLKNMTNIDKLRLVSEAALLRIGSLELEFAERYKDIQKQNYIKETNHLLKKFWSLQKIRDPDTDVHLKLKRIFAEFVSKIREYWERKESIGKVDTESFVYYKNIRELNIYKRKLHEIEKDIIIATILFRHKKYDRLILKKRLVIQNIQLIEKRISNTKFSYTRLVKGFQYYLDIILLFVRFLGEISLYIVFFFSLAYCGFMIAFPNGYFINYTPIYFISLIAFFSLLTKFARNFPLLITSGCMYILFVIFIRINF